MKQKYLNILSEADLASMNPSVREYVDGLDSNAFLILVHMLRKIRQRNVWHVMAQLERLDHELPEVPPQPIDYMINALYVYQRSKDVEFRFPEDDIALEQDLVEFLTELYPKLKKD